tara:strand:- start:8 stop:6763 length:6756 start_codon:yes stop_codon:yes gene_type:complete
MLNTFRVIFVDNNGVEQNPTVGICEYLQTGQPGYYAFDHGQPSQIAGNDGVSPGSYSYDSRTINTWYRKYGTEFSRFDDGRPNPPLWPPPESGSGILYSTAFGELATGLSGSIFSSPGMTSPTKREDGTGILPFEFDGDGNGFIDGWSIPESWWHYKKDLGVTLDLRTPTYFFNDAGNSDKRVISRTQNTEFNYSAESDDNDLSFTSSPASPPQTDEVDLSDTSEQPKWIYIGVMGAGGPAGAQIQSLAFGGGGGGPQPNCTLGGYAQSDAIGLCTAWVDNTNYACSGAGGGQDDESSVTAYPIMGYQYRGVASWAQDGGRGGVFLNACKLGLDPTGTTRKTLVVRVNQLGRGGVEEYNNSYREPKEAGDINTARTVFPEWATRRTSITIYDAGNDNKNLGPEDEILNINVDGGWAQIMSVYGVIVDNPCYGWDTPGFCASCANTVTDNPADDVVDCTQTCWFDYGDWLSSGSGFNREVWVSSDDTETTGSPPAPAFTVTGSNDWIENQDYIVSDELSRINRGDGQGFSGVGGNKGKFFPPEIEEKGILDEKDWYRKAGGIQATPETITLSVDSRDITGFFGLGEDFIFNGDTKYIFEQDDLLGDNVGFTEVSPVIPAGAVGEVADNDDEGTNINPVRLEYFRFDSDTNEYVLLENLFFEFGDTELFLSPLMQYERLNRDPSSDAPPFNQAPYWQNVTKAKIEYTTPLNSYANTLRVSVTQFNPDPTLPDVDVVNDFEFHRSTDQLIPTPSLGGRMAATMTDAAGRLFVSPYGDNQGDGGVDPGEPTVGIGGGEDEFAEGVGGNGGSVFIGWGEEINEAAQKALENRGGVKPEQNPGQTQLSEFVLRGSPSGAEIQFGEGPWPDYRRFRPKTENLFPVSSDTYYDDSPRSGSISSHAEFFVANTGSINEDLTFNQRVRSAYDMDTTNNPYKQVGDPNAKGYDVAPIARFTELPELTREGDFYLTLQAYHMEGIHKVTFVMDKGWGVDVYTPVKHPDDLGTNYEGSATRIGKDYEEYMVKVSTEDMENNSVHEIRAIVWPNSGYPLVLQGEKQDSNRFIKGSASASGNAGIEIADELYKVTPTSYPWIPNRYPEMMGEYNPNQLDVNGNPLTIAPNPDTGGITLIDEPAWYSLDSQPAGYLDTINVDPADVKGQYIKGDAEIGEENGYVGQQIRTWQAVPGGLVDNFEGHVDDKGEPAWWIPGAETNNVGYHGFWFRYQKSGDATVPADTNKYPDEGHRRVLYVDSSVDVNSSGRDTNLLGTIDHPYQSLDEVMEALETGDHPEIATGTYEIEDYFSAKLILLGQKDSPAEGEPAGRIFKWWGSDNVITSGFQNTLDHNESRNSAQNPSCQMLTVEARKVNSETGIPVPWEEGAPIDFHPDQEAVEIHDKEVVLLLNDFGWGREFNGGEDDPSKDNGGTPFNANIHYKNFRCVTDLPTSGTDEVFRVSANTRRCDTWGPQYQEDVDDWRYKAPTEILDNCKFNSWSEWGAVSQLTYTDRSVLLRQNKIARPGPPHPADAGCDQNECSYDEIADAPLDRSKMRSIDVTLLDDGVHPAVWEKVGTNMNYIWEGDRFPDPDDIIGPNRQLLDDRLPGYNTLIRWSFGDPVEISAQEAAISNGDAPEDYPDGLYVSTLNNGRGPDGVLPGDRIGLTFDPSFNWRPLKVTETDGVVFGEGVPNQKRSTGSLKNDSAFTRKLIEGYPLNLDVYSSNCITSKYGAGRRFVGVSLVKNYIESSAAGDTTARSTSGIINSIVDVRSISYFTGKRLFANGSNTTHGDLNQVDGLDIGWTDNRIHADVLMPNNGSQLAHFSGGIVRRRNSKCDLWRSAHKLRNWAIVNVISDTNQVSATWNCFESFDHLYIRGNRLNKSLIRLAANQRHGVPYLGERYDNRISHFYMADVNNGQVGIEAPTSGDGIQGGWEVVNTSIADPEYKGFARPRPREFVDTEGTVFPGVFNYKFARDNSKAAFWPQLVSNQNGGYLDNKGKKLNAYEATPLPTNQLYWYPVYDSQNLTSPGNYTADRNSQLIDNENDYDEMLKRSLAQYCDVDNSIVRFDTCIFRKWGSGGGKMVQGNIETNIFNQNGIPTIEKAYLIQGDDPSLDNLVGRKYAVSAPNGVPVPDNANNTFTIDLDDIAPLNGDIQTVSFIPTYAGVSSDIERLSQGFTAPPGYNGLDPNSPDGEWNDVKDFLKSNVEFVPTLNTANGGEQWPRAGKVVEAYYIYDRELFKQIIANGGWNYTPKLLEDLNIDYTPHKL